MGGHTSFLLLPFMGKDRGGCAHPLFFWSAEILRPPPPHPCCANPPTLRLPNKSTSRQVGKSASRQASAVQRGGAPAYRGQFITHPPISRTRSPACCTPPPRSPSAAPLRLPGGKPTARTLTPCCTPPSLLPPSRPPSPPCYYCPHPPAFAPPRLPPGKPPPAHLRAICCVRPINPCRLPLFSLTQPVNLTRLNVPPGARRLQTLPRPINLCRLPPATRSLSPSYPPR